MLQHALGVVRWAPATAAARQGLPPPNAWGRPCTRRRQGLLPLAALEPSCLLSPIGDLAAGGFEEAAALGVSEKVVLLASASFSTLSLVITHFSGQATEQRRAELALELEREKARRAQLGELYDVTAQYRGPLLEAAIDLEQALWHLITDAGLRQQPAEPLSADCADCDSNRSYVMFTIAQLLGFVEVLRRESPRERTFLQAGRGSDVLTTLVEGMRFALCSAPAGLQCWYDQGSSRPHPGSRSRTPRADVVRQCRQADEQAAAEGMAPAADIPLRIPRGMQRAIGTLMITTPMGTERHYTQAYGDFHGRLEADASFRRWFTQMEAEVADLSSGQPWAGQPPFPLNRWTRALLLQQLLVELIDLLDPDCVRLPMERRQRLMPVAWGPLPRLAEYHAQLKALQAAVNFSEDARPGSNGSQPLAGLLDLLRPPPVEEEEAGENGGDGGAAAAAPGAAAQQK